MSENGRSRTKQGSNFIKGMLHPNLWQKIIMALIALALVAGGSYWLAWKHYTKPKAEPVVRSSVNVKQIKKIGQLDVLSVSYQQLVKVSKDKKVAFTKISYGNALDIVEIQGQVRLGVEAEDIEIKNKGNHSYEVGIPSIKVLTVSNTKQDLIFSKEDGFAVENTKEDLQNAINKQLSKKSEFAEKIKDENEETAYSSSKNVIRSIITGMDPNAKVSFHQVN